MPAVEVLREERQSQQRQRLHSDASRVSRTAGDRARQVRLQVHDGPLRPRAHHTELDADRARRGHSDVHRGRPERKYTKYTGLGMHPLARLRRSERGAVVAMVAVWLPVLAIFASFAIDFGHFFDYSRNLQNRADASAYAGGDQLGNVCAGNPTSGTTAPELPIGQMTQLFSGPP